MKKLFSILLAAALMLTCLFQADQPVRAEEGDDSDSSAATAGTTSAESAQLPMFMNPLDISAHTGIQAAPTGFHSGHQTRIVHTSHGDYIALMTGEIPYPGDAFHNEEIISILKVEGSQVKVLYQDIQCYNSSSISIFADENEEVYAATVLGNAYSVPSFDSMNLAVYHVDSKTDEVRAYKTTIVNAVGGSYGYGQPVIDPAADKIYMVVTGGNGAFDGTLNWFSFDLSTMRWDPDQHALTPSDHLRYVYHYLFGDGNGGFIDVNEKTCNVGMIGHNEIATAPVWSANFQWDGLAYYYIPDTEVSEQFTFQFIEDGDYSRVKDLDGDGLYESDEERKTNEYPGVLNNHQGDTMIDSQGLLHVLYTVTYNQNAYDRSVCFENIEYHAVYDISDKSSPVLVSKDQLYFDEPEGTKIVKHEFRMVEGADGTLYIVCCNLNTESENYGKFQLYRLNAKEGGGYEYELAGMSDNIGAEWGFSLANSRSFSLADDTAVILYRAQADDAKISYEIIHLKGDPDVKDTTDPNANTDNSSEASSEESSGASSEPSGEISSETSSEASSQASSETSSQASSTESSSESSASAGGGKGWIAIPIVVAAAAIAAALIISKKHRK